MRHLADRAWVRVVAIGAELGTKQVVALSCLTPARVALDILLAGQEDRQHGPERGQDAPPEGLEQDGRQEARQAKIHEDAPPRPAPGPEKNM